MNARSAASVGLCLCALAASGLVACPGLDALTRAPDGGGAGDATAHDAIAQDATQDAAPAPDASSPADAGQDAGSDAEDAGAACVFVDAAFVDALAAVPEGGCAVAEGGACSAGYNPEYFGYFALPAPRAHQSRCTFAQIAAYLDACPIPYPFGPASPACQSFVNDQANVACVSCLGATPASGTVGGPILFTQFGSSEDIEYNAYGCIELVEPCNARCAQAMWDGYQCPIIGCYPSCPLADVSACAQATAQSCLCASLSNAETQCINGIQASGGPAATQCLVASGILATFCGP